MALSKDKTNAVWEGSVTDVGGRVTVASAAFPEQPLTLKRRLEGACVTTIPAKASGAAHVPFSPTERAGALPASTRSPR